MKTNHLSVKSALPTANVVATKMNYSFAPGCGRVSKADYRNLNEELRQYLGCKSMTHYYYKRKRYVDIPAHIKEGIEEIFAKYNVLPEFIWEITPLKQQP